MNGTIKSVWDTNAVIDWLQGNSTFQSVIKEHDLNSDIAVSQITRMEILARRGINEQDLSSVHTFLRRSFVVFITPEVEEEAIRLRHDCRIKLPDAIVAATARVCACPLVTRDLELIHKLGDRLVVFDANSTAR
ncbi:MAG: type II toxin-antitoxin system VapC family toxin [Candidatus Hydrogenedentes bacterium]|nr:type II toxin-antitoxin system VapC family toxin [Candidatus Hydrogenedentota bacterium]